MTGSASATTISSAASSGRAGDNDDAGSIRSALSETSDPFKYDAMYTSSSRGLSQLAAPSVSSLHETDDRSSGQQGQMRQSVIGVAARNKELPPAPVSPLSASPTEQYLVAKHDYTGTPGVCLSFSAGQLIKLVSKHESGWWDGELDGQRGWFPSNFVDEVSRLCGVSFPAENVLLTTSHLGACSHSHWRLRSMAARDPLRPNHRNRWSAFRPSQ